MRASDDHSADTPENAAYWRRIGSGSARMRNLAEIDHRRMVAESVRAAQRDPMAKAHLRLVTSITVGAMEAGPEVRGGTPESRKELQRHLDSVWNEARNEWPSRLPSLMTGLCSTGSLALTIHQGGGSARTLVGYLDPEEFVSPGIIVDPDNVFDRIALLREGDDVVPFAHPVLRPDGTKHSIFDRAVPGDTVSLPRRRSKGGPIKAIVAADVVYAGCNFAAPNQTVGISDLFAAVDVMALTDELVFSGANRSINLGAYSLHVTFPRGTLKDAIDKAMAAIRADLESGQGRAIGTTEDIGIKAVFPSLQSGEWQTMEEMVRKSALIGLGPWPIHMFSDGGATNQAAAAEQGSPVANFLLTRQNEFRRAIEQVLMCALRGIPEARKILDSDPALCILLPLPVIVAKDTTRESNVLSVEMSAISHAREAGFVTTSAAQRLARDSFTRYGLPVREEDAPDADEVDAERSVTFALPPLRVASERELDPDQTRSQGTPQAA